MVSGIGDVGSGLALAVQHTVLLDPGLYTLYIPVPYISYPRAGSTGIPWYIALYSCTLLQYWLSSINRYP